jgi:hypothetical protein
LDLYYVAKTYNEHSLVEDCLSFVAENIEPVLLDTRAYLSLPQDTLIDILDRDDITCDEVTLFNMVIDWYEHQQKSEDAIFESKFGEVADVPSSEPTTPASSYPVVIDLQKVMSKIRWVLMGPQKLIVEMKQHIGKYFTMKDYEEAIEFFAMPKKYKVRILIVLFTILECHRQKVQIPKRIVSICMGLY